MTSSKIILICCLCLFSSHLKAKTTDGSLYANFFDQWKKAWNTTDKTAILSLINGSYIPHKKSNELMKHLINEYGKIKSIRFTNSYDKSLACSAIIEFNNKFTMPFVFLFIKQNDKLKFKSFFAGQDPAIKRDDKMATAFIEKYKKTWNEKSSEMFLALLHSTCKLKIQLKGVPKDTIDNIIKNQLIAPFGKIQTYKIIGYKERTNEYIVLITYKLKSDIKASMSFVTDKDNKLKLFNFDIDSGERALVNKNSWRPQ